MSTFIAQDFFDSESKGYSKLGNSGKPGEN